MRKIILLLSLVVTGLLISDTYALARERKKKCSVLVKKVSKKGIVNFSKKKKSCPKNYVKAFKLKALTSNSCPPQPKPNELCNSSTHGILIKNCRAEYISDSSALLSWETYANDSTIPYHLQNKGLLIPVPSDSQILGSQYGQKAIQFAWGRIDNKPGILTAEHHVPIKPSIVANSSSGLEFDTAYSYLLSSAAYEYQHSGITKELCFKTLGGEFYPFLSSHTLKSGAKLSGIVPIQYEISGESSDISLFYSTNNIGYRRLATVNTTGKYSGTIDFDTRLIPNGTYQIHLGIQNSKNYGVLDTFTVTVDNQNTGTCSSTGPCATVVNSANNFKSTFAPSSIFTIYGTRLASGTEYANGFSLPKTMQGTKVLVKIDGIYNEAPLSFVSPNQINAQVPLDTGRSTYPGTKTIYPIIGELKVVNSYGQTVTNFKIDKYAPEIYQNGKIPLMLHADPNGDGKKLSLVSDQDEVNFARIGEVVMMYLNGLGIKKDPFILAGLPAQGGYPMSKVGNPSEENEHPEVVIGDVVLNNTSVRYAKAAPFYVGLDQINFKIPENDPRITAGTHDLKICFRNVDLNDRGAKVPSICSATSKIVISAVKSPHSSAIGLNSYATLGQNSGVVISNLTSPDIGTSELYASETAEIDPPSRPLPNPRDRISRNGDISGNEEIGGVIIE